MSDEGTSVLEQAAGRAADRVRSPVWAPLAVALSGFVAVTMLLLVVGELVTHVGFLGGLRRWDDHVNRWLAAHRTSRWDGFSTFWSKAAETVPIVAVALLLEAFLALRRRWRDLLLVALGLAIEITIFLAVNELVRRPRPSVAKLGLEPSTYSFPSGHIAATLVLYGSVAFLCWSSLNSRFVAVLGCSVVLLVASAVGFARVYRGMHHPSDVIAGALMGSAALVVALVASRASALADRAPQEEK